jgi:predicted enzyme related to lactoylglutathione lyase
MPRIVHFEFGVDDPARAEKFYTSVFGWKFDKFGGPMEYWLISTGEGPGIDGGMMRRMPGMTTINTIDVANIEEAIQSVEAHGGKLVKPVDQIPGVGRFAYCADTEGNVFGVIQQDAPAA